MAKSIEKKKMVLYKFLNEILKVSNETAQKDAHKMEHDLSEETISKIIKFTENMKNCNLS